MSEKNVKILHKNNIRIADFSFKTFEDVGIYLWSVKNDDDNSIFHSFSEQNFDKIVFLYPSLKREKFYSDKCGKISKRALSSSDRFLIFCGISKSITLPMAYSFFKMYGDIGFLSLKNSIIARLLKKGYIVSVKRTDLPVLGHNSDRYYGLTSEGVDHLKNCYPELDFSTFSPLSAESNGKLLHDYHAHLSAMIVTKHILDNSKYNPLPEIEKNGQICIYFEKQLKSILSGRGANFRGNTWADSVIRAGDLSLWLEMDMDTEKPDFLLEKAYSYCRDDKVRYGEGAFDTAFSAVILLVHSPSSSKMSMPRADHLSDGVLRAIAKSCDLSCENVLDGEGAIFKASVRKALEGYSGGEGEHKCDKILSDAGRFDDCMKVLYEIVSFYHEVAGAQTVSDALLFHALPYEERYLPENTDGDTFKYGMCRMMDVYETAGIQRKVSDRKLDFLRKAVLDKVATFSYTLPADDVIRSLCAGFSFQILPELMDENVLDLADLQTVPVRLGTLADKAFMLAYGTSPQASFSYVYDREGAGLTDIGYSNVPLRLRNCFISDKGCVSFEYAWDIFALARVKFFVKSVIRCRKNKTSVPNAHIVIVCRDEAEALEAHGLVGGSACSAPDLSDELLLLYCIAGNEDLFYAAADELGNVFLAKAGR